MDLQLKLEISIALIGLNEDHTKSQNCANSSDVVYHHIRDVLKKYSISSVQACEILKDMRGSFSKKMYLNVISQILNYLNDFEDIEFNNVQRPIQEIFIFQNNFDGVPPINVFDFFNKKLVQDHKYLELETLKDFIFQAFEKQEIPKNKFVLKNIKTKQKIIAVFYEYYKVIAGKPTGAQINYASLLGEYFNGFTTVNVSTNFTK
jgi:hypothetical protein